MAFTDTPPDISKTPYGGTPSYGQMATTTLDQLNALMGQNEQTKASNLGTELSARLAKARSDAASSDAYQGAVNARTGVNMAGQADAWKKLQQAAFVQNFNPATFGPNLGKNPYFRPLTAPSADVVAGAKSLADTSRDALMSGQYTNNSGAPLPGINPSLYETIPDNLMTPPKQSTWSKILKGAGLAAPYVMKAFGV